MLIILAIASSFFGGAVIFMLDEKHKKIRTVINISVAVLKIFIMIALIIGVSRGLTYRVSFELLPNVDIILKADPLALLFATLSAFLWFLTTIYAIGYLENAPDRARFFGFFAWCVCATTGVAFAGNLFTFLIFYEMLTLATYPLVVHRGTKESIRAGRIYLLYTLLGGTVLLVAVIWLRSLVGPIEFQPGGVMALIDPALKTQLIIVFAMLIAGFGVKAALFPFHGWLPNAMVAPAPVSALLHAVAVVKAGAFGIVRIIYEVYGISYADMLGVLFPLAILASFTIVYGSIRAVFQDDIKKRLAYSTISQVSYITLGATIFGPIATIGGLVHIVHQALMKITLFFAAGNLAETHHIHKVSELNGIAKKMPLTMTAFTIGALGMIGMPPLAGFVSKWYIGQGALDSGQYWVIGILITSALLNALYFLPILYVAWFKAPDQSSANIAAPKPTLECSWSLLGPPLITALLTVFVGLFASTGISPLEWARFVMELEYL